jgi:cardiolipin synthase
MECSIKRATSSNSSCDSAAVPCGMRISRRHWRPASLFTAIVITCSLCFLSPPTGASGSVTGLTGFVEPAAGFGFLDHAILDARHTIELSMYELEDPTIESDLVARARAGVVVQVILDSEYGILSVNTPAKNILTRGGVRVVWAPASQIFHAKYLIIDGTKLFIGTANFTAQYYSSTRDFWILDRNRVDIDAAKATFAADFAHRSAPLGKGNSDLVWSPGSTDALVNLISSAKHSLLIENEEMDSYTIESALEAAASRGVDVDVVMTYDSEWHDALSQLAQAGVHVHVLSSNQVYIHAKVICADCSAGKGTVFVGSENFSTSSLSYNRELGIITSEPSVTRDIASTVLADYAQGTANF